MDIYIYIYMYIIGRSIYILYMYMDIYIYIYIHIHTFITVCGAPQAPPAPCVSSGNTHFQMCVMLLCCKEEAKILGGQNTGILNIILSKITSSSAGPALAGPKPN